MKSENILFSIIVPVYNMEKYLDKCVSSILSQTYNNYELILVNDGSTDNSAYMCDEYKKKDYRVRVIHKDNGGLVSARKAGVLLAKGDYAVCIDSDDWIKNTYLQKLFNIIDQYHPDIICFNFTKVLNEKNILSFIPFRKGLYTKQDIENDIFPYLIQTESAKYFPPAIWAKAYKLDLYRTEQLLIDNRIKIGEDAACTIPCIYKAKTLYIYDEHLYFYRHNNDSMTKNRKPFSWNTPELIEQHLRKRIEVSEFDFQQQISRRTVHALINVVTTQFYSCSKYNSIKKSIKSEISRPIYKKSLIDSKVKKWTHIWICKFFLLHNMYFPFYILSKLR